MKDRLFLMKPGFTNAGLGPFYCGDSVSVEGMLGFFPELRDQLDIQYIEFPRPRQPITDLLGEENQSVPVLILAEGGESPNGIPVKKAGDSSFINDEKQIREYLSARFDLPHAG